MHSIAAAATLLLALRVLGAVVGLLASVAISRVLGAQSAGAIFWAIGICAVVAGVSRLGIDTALMRDVALAESTGDQSRVAKLATTAYALVLSVGAAITVALLIVFQIQTESPSRHAVYPVLFAVPGLAVLGVAAAVLIGRSRAIQSISLQSLLPPLVFVMGAVTIGRSNGTTGVAFSYMTAVWLTVCLAAVLSLQYTRVIHWEIDLVLVKRLISSSPALFLIGLSKIWMEWGGTIILGGMHRDAEAAYFSAATRITGALAFLVAAVEAHLAPRLAVALRSESGAAVAKRLFTEARSTTLVISIPAVLILVAFAPDILAIFGSEFRAGAAVLRVLCFGQLVNALTGPSTIFVLMNAEYSQIMKISVQAVVLSVLLASVLAPELGVMGIAIAFAAAFAWIHVRAYSRVSASLDSRR